MMGTNDPQPSMFYSINLEQFVSEDKGKRSLSPEGIKGQRVTKTSPRGENEPTGTRTC